MPAAIYLWIAVGGAIGSVCRFGLSEFLVHRLGHAWPWGTLTVNIVGSFILGLLTAVSVPEGSRLLSGDAARALLMVGFCGGFTTFSTFSVQTLLLLEEGRFAAAAANIVGSVVLCLAAAWVGYSLGPGHR